MSRKANPAAIGAFIVGAVALAAAGAVLVGADLLSQKNRFVMYFSGSVAGLQVGAPVSFRGVRIGSVADIRVQLDVRDSSVRTPVFVDIDPRRITEIGEPADGVARYKGAPERRMRVLVERGLRGRLRTVSMVTGLAEVDLDFHPETPVQLVDIDTGYPELPTVPSTMEQLTSTLAELPVDEVVALLRTTLQSIESLVSSPETQSAPANLNATLADLRRLIDTLDRNVEPLTASLERTSDAAGSALEEVRATMRSTDERLASLVADLEETSRAARATLEQVRHATAGSSDLQYELTVTLGEVADAARSLRAMADTLEQHPEALLRGKREPKEKR